MVLRFFGSGDSTMSEVEERILQMVRDSRVVYDAATEAVFGGGKSKATRATVRETDWDINTGQREVRRALLIHASVSPRADVAQVLAFMSVVKDVERIGDYAKNIYDLARYGVDFEAAPDAADLAEYRDAVGQLISDAAEVYSEGDVETAQALIAKADGFLDDYDRHVKAAYRSEGPTSDAVARALYFRFLKRITAHVMNFLTSLVLPLDQLDYYDEPRDAED